MIYLQENPSAEELAEAIGLTSGAITALIDRLERNGYVERLSDPRIRHDAIEPIIGK